MRSDVLSVFESLKTYLYSAVTYHLTAWKRLYAAPICFWHPGDKAKRELIVYDF